MREGGVALVSVNLEFNPLKLGAADDENFKVGRVTRPADWLGNILDSVSEDTEDTAYSCILIHVLALSYLDSFSDKLIR